jgi:hypothetical protein
VASIESVTLEVADPTAVNGFYTATLPRQVTQVLAEIDH